MPVPGTARSYTGAHVTTGYDASARRANNVRKESQNLNQRKSRRGGRK